MRHPVPSAQVSGGDRVLVVAAHPDDEVLGCGGTIARHVAAGDRVTTLFLADGEAARPGGDAVAIGRRREAALAAASRLGTAVPIFFAFPDNRMDGVPLLDIVKAVEGVVREALPRIVYTHHAGDLNIDHRLAHQATLTACRPLPGHPVERIYAFEVPSATEWGGGTFTPSRFVDIAPSLAALAGALDAYAEELRPSPHPRSREAIEARQRWRGATVGLAAAEAFEILRHLDRSP